MASPREIINAVIGDGPSAYLKALGFRRRARHFFRVDAESSAHVHFQASVGNGGDHIRFTINLFRHYPLLAARLGEAEDDMVKRRAQLGLRIGHVMPVATDYWWELTSIADAAQTGRNVTTALREYGLPYLDSVARIADIVVDNPRHPDWLRPLPPSPMFAEALSLLGREPDAQAMRAALEHQRRARLGVADA